MSRFTDRTTLRQGRDLGASARLTTLLALAFGGLLFAAESRSVLPVLAFWAVLVLPRDFPLFRKMGALHPTVAFGILCVAGAAILLGGVALASQGRVHGLVPFAWFAMLVTASKSRQTRLATGDHVFLLTGAAVLVFAGTAQFAGDPFLLPLLAVWTAVTAVAVFRVHLAAQAERVLALSLVRSYERATAEEIYGRDQVRSPDVIGFLTMISFWLVVIAFLLAWVAPYAVTGGRIAWESIAASEEEGEGLPEAGPGVAPFAIPPGMVGFLPFGARLDRDEFRYRLEAEGVALLMRPSDQMSSPGTGLLVRGECYDFLTRKGQWIQANAHERSVHDADDPTRDGRIHLPGRPTRADAYFEYLIPPGPDRTVYLLPTPVSIGIPSLRVDGVGNIRTATARAPKGKYAVSSWSAGAAWKTIVVPQPPEFLLLPEDLDARAIADLVRPALTESEDPFHLVLAAKDWLRASYLRWEEPEPPTEQDEAAPRELDVKGFLFDRRWGNNLDFATAFAMVLRSVGVPCRLVTGYKEGEFLRDAGFWVFRARHAWAWVEVPFAGKGWVQFDATAPELEELDEEDREAIFSVPPEERAEEAQRLLEEAKRPTLLHRFLDAVDEFVSSVLPGSRKTSALGRVVSWLVVVALVLFVLWAVFHLGGRVRAYQGRDRGGKAAVKTPTFYERLLRVLARHGIRRKASQTPLEFAREAVRICGPELDDVKRLTNAFCAHRYGERELTRETGRALVKRVRNVDRLLSNRPQRPVAGVAPTAAVALLLSLSLLAWAQPPADLVRSLGSEDAAVREKARAALLAAGEGAVPALVSVLRAEAPDGRAARIGKLVRQLDSNSFRERELATEALKGLGPEIRPALREVVQRGSPEASLRAAAIIAFLDEKGALLADQRKREEAIRRRQAIDLLSRIGGPQSVDAIAQAGLSWPELRIAAVGALARLSAKRLPEVLALLDRLDRDVRRLALDVLVLARRPEAMPRILALLEDPDPELRKIAAVALVTPEVVEETDRARRLLSEFRYDAAEATLRRVLRLCPGYAEAGRLLITILDGRKAFAEALDLARGLVLPKVEKDLLIAELMAEAGDREAALTRLAEIPEPGPGCFEAHVLAARILLHADPPRPHKAMEQAVAATEYAPDVAFAWALLGRIHGEYLDDAAEALIAYTRARDLDMENAEYQTGVLRYMGR